MTPTKVYLNVARALQICLILTIWPTNSAVDVCEENQYWDAIQERCSACEGICRVYDRTIHKECQRICFPENRECKGKEFDPSGLATKSDVSRLETWLIILSVFVGIIILWGFVDCYKKYKNVSRSTVHGENNTQGDAAEICLLDIQENHGRNREDQPDNPDIPEKTEPRQIDEPGCSSADHPTGINNVQGPNKPERGLAGDVSYDSGNPRRQNRLELPRRRVKKHH